MDQDLEKERQEVDYGLRDRLEHADHRWHGDGAAQICCLTQRGGSLSENFGFVETSESLLWLLNGIDYPHQYGPHGLCYFYLC